MVVLVLTGCKSKKPMVETVVSQCSLKDSTLNSLNSFPDSSSKYYYKIKGKVNAILSKEAIDLDIQLRIKPNELIWLSLSKGGFPVAKVLLKKDSIFALDLFHRKYLSTDYSFVASKFGVALDFSILQSVVLGQYIPFSGEKQHWYRQNEAVVSNFSKDSVRHYQKEKKGLDKVLWSQWLNCNLKNITQQYIQTHNQEEVWVRYSEIDTSTQLILPKNISIEVNKQTDKKLISTIKYNKFKSANAMNIPFEIPEDYEKMD